MALVAYSDSESDGESSSAPQPLPVASKAKSSLSSFLPPPSKKRKLVDTFVSTTGPRKIVVDLPKSIETTEDRDDDKRKAGGSKSGGSGMLGFLPAPKRTGAAAVAVLEEVKTEVVQSKPRVLGGAAKVEYVATSMETSITPSASEPAKPAPVKGRTIQPFIRKSAQGKKNANGIAVVEPKKVSLFSMGAALQDTRAAPSTLTGEYQPLLIDSVPKIEPTPIKTPEPEAEAGYAYEASVDEGPQSLESLGQSVGLDEGAMRQLMGRRGKNAPVNMIDFNVDEEYNANEKARLAGELEPQKNVVRSIAPGKHQLSSLLNAAQSNRQALEESFLSGRKNKKEAGSKYGW